MKTEQVAEVISQGGRYGRVEAPDTSLALSLGDPSNDSSATTPEHLFGAAYAACFHSAILGAAERGHFQIEGSTVIARVDLLDDGRGGYQLKVNLRASLPGVSESDAKHLLHQAHQSCPYSRAVRGNIDVSLTLD